MVQRCCVVECRVSDNMMEGLINGEADRFEYDGKEYTLEFTGNLLRQWSDRALLQDIGDKPMTTLPALLAGAFLAHHRYIKKNLLMKSIQR